MINTASSPVDLVYTVTPTSDTGCLGEDFTVTITVNPTGQVDDPQDQVLCNNDTTLPVTFTTDNTGGVTTYAWTNDTPGIGLAASGDGDIDAFVAVNTGTSPVTATITVVPTFTNQDVSCIGPSETFTITVNPTGQVDDPQDQVLCNNDDAIVEFTTDNTGGTTVYGWSSDLDIGFGTAGRVTLTLLLSIQGLHQ